MDTQLKKPSTNSVGNWTPEEDEVILRYVYDKGKGDEHMMWGNLSDTLNSRSGKSCRERWFNHLDPKIKRTEWSQEEQWVLFILRNQCSEKWSLISKKLMGRTDNAVKNYWNSRLKKRIDSMQHAVNQHFERKKKQKILQMLQSQQGDSQANEQQQSLSSNALTQMLTKEQKHELNVYMGRIRAEYLQKILDQVNLQNIEYFENLACEYTLQLMNLNSDKPNKAVKKQPLILDEKSSSAFPTEFITFMQKPEVIQMHLDILYKSVQFLDKQKIEDKIELYKDSKEKKKREEQERLQIQIQMKKSRGRQSAKKEKYDDDMLDQGISVIQNQKMLTSVKKNQVDLNQDSSNDQVTVNNFHDIQNGVFKKNSIENRSDIKSKNDTIHNNLDQKYKSKFETKSQQQFNTPRKSARINNQGIHPSIQKSRIDTKHSENESSYNSSQSQESKLSLQKTPSESKRAKKVKKSGNLRRILRRFRKQQRQSKLIDKIFVSQKEIRPKNIGNMTITDPYAIKPRPLNLQINQNENNQDQLIQESNIINNCQQNIKNVQFTINQSQDSGMKKQVPIKKKLIKKGSFKKSSLNGSYKEQSPNPKVVQDADVNMAEDQSFSKIIYTNNGNNTTNNIENTNNYFNQVYNFKCSNVEHVVQNIYITGDENGNPIPTQSSNYSTFPAESHIQPDQVRLPSFPTGALSMTKAYSVPQQFHNDFIIQNPVIENSASHPRRETRVSRGRAVKVQMQPNMTAESYQSPDQRVPHFQSATISQPRSISGSRGRSIQTGPKNAQTGMYSTGNFFNQTMTQIVQGKQREMQPLIRKKKNLMQHPDFNDEYLSPQLQQHQAYQFSNPQVRHYRTTKAGMEQFTPQFNRVNTPSLDLMTQQSTPMLGRPQDQKFNRFAQKQADIDQQQFENYNNYQTYRMDTPQFQGMQLNPPIQMHQQQPQRVPQQISSFNDSLHAAQTKPTVQFVPRNALHNLAAQEGPINLGASVKIQKMTNYQQPFAKNPVFINLNSRERERSFDLSHDIFMKANKGDRDNSGSCSASGRMRTTSNQNMLNNYFRKVTEQITEDDQSVGGFAQKQGPFNSKPHSFQM